MYAFACGQSQPPDLKLHYERTVQYETHESTLPGELCTDCRALCGADALSGPPGLWNCANPLFRGSLPVSYTHLDVYKRQIRYRD